VILFTGTTLGLIFPRITSDSGCLLLLSVRAVKNISLRLVFIIKANKVIIMSRPFLIILIIAILLAATFLPYLLVTYYHCSVWNPGVCDISCSVDNDCKSSACRCINRDETIFTSRQFLFLTEEASLNCVVGTCKCVNNKCEFLEE